MIQGHPPVFSASEKRRGVSSMPSSTRSAALEIFCTGHNVAQYFRNVTVAQVTSPIFKRSRYQGRRMGCIAGRDIRGGDSPRSPARWEQDLLQRKIREVIDVPKAVEQSGNDLLPELLQQFVEHWPGEKRALEKAVKEKDHKALGTISQRIKKDANLLCLKNVKATCDTIIGLSAVLQRAESSDESKKNILTKRSELLENLTYHLNDVASVANYIQDVVHRKNELKNHKKQQKIRNRQCRTKDVFIACGTRPEPGEVPCDMLHSSTNLLEDNQNEYGGG
ncbi:hypothetical protein AAMO2058_001149800 [Amorphochlora amoebiformis]